MGLKFTIQCQVTVSNLCCISSRNLSRLIDSESRGINVMFPSSLTGLVFPSRCKQLVCMEVWSRQWLHFSSATAPQHQPQSTSLPWIQQSSKSRWAMLPGSLFQFYSGRKVLILKIFAFKHSFLQLTKAIQIWVKSLQPEVLSQARVKYLVLSLFFCCVSLRIYSKYWVGLPQDRSYSMGELQPSVHLLLPLHLCRPHCAFD